MYRPAVTLLGKAVEGAWTELGIALYKYAEGQINDMEKLIEKLQNETHYMKRIQSVVRHFGSREDIYRPLVRESGITLHILQEISFWSDVVRDARNAIHFGVTPIIPNTYEKLAVLLMSAASHLKTIYMFKEYADAQ